MIHESPDGGKTINQRETYISVPKDAIVQSVIDKFSKRSEIGIKKYGTTLQDNNNDDYLTHLQEELMDAILYIEKLKTILQNGRKSSNKV